MKLTWLFVGLATVTAGMVVLACAPKEKYCFDEHRPCSEVKTMRQMMCEDENARAMDAGLPPTRDCGS